MKRFLLGLSLFAVLGCTDATSPVGPVEASFSSHAGEAPTITNAYAYKLWGLWYVEFDVAGGTAPYSIYVRSPYYYVATMQQAGHFWYGVYDYTDNRKAVKGPWPGYEYKVCGAGYVCSAWVAPEITTPGKLGY